MSPGQPLAWSPRGGPPRGRALLVATWAYALTVLSALASLRWLGSGYPLAVLLLLVPRWLFLAPALPLALASGWRRCPWHWPIQGATALAVAGPLMGLSIPWHALWARPPAGDAVRVVTYNMATQGLDVPRFVRWVTRERADLILIQEELKRNSGLRQALAPLGWSFSRKGMIASRLPILHEFDDPHGESRPGERYAARLNRVRVRTRGGPEVVVASVHLPTLRYGLMGTFRQADAAALLASSDWWGAQLAAVVSALAETSDQSMVVGGDFNLPADDSRMAALGAHFRFAFEEAGWGYGYTRPARFSWVRIDHLLASPEWGVSECRVGPDFGSDHLPLLAELVLGPPPPPPPKTGGSPAGSGTTVAGLAAGE